ncbi:hypothetical protein FMUND_2383 [Fusarium mundagurra]|uniref:Uncharacterized protein n=1 Tax=Fusarium mundagurra TaxID=1567541 RepID=A0A8H6DMP2_9HYPO|nr:hypothetical protein FMUND_2383 [Fusarium mundagurra]
MKPWHEKALKHGRTPLPEGPGHRPWLPLQPSERRFTNMDVSGASQDPNHAEDAVPISVPAEASESRGLSYRFWKESELTYHKRRHAVEQKIGEKSSEKSAEKD